MSVNKQAVIIGNGDIFGTTAVFLAIIPVFMIARALAVLGRFKWAAKLLSGASIVGKLAVLPHSETGITDEIANGKFFGVFRIPLIKRNTALTLVCIFHGIVNGFDIITFIADKSAFFDGDKIVGFAE